MEFIDFLDREEIELIRLVENAGYSIEENTDLCLKNKRYKGFLINKQKTIVICTENAKKRENYMQLKTNNSDTFDRTSRLIKKALRHESVHVAQECNNGKLIELKQKKLLNPAKIEALKGSMNISLNEEKERQAYILEDKPSLVKNELIKYCL